MHYFFFIIFFVIFNELTYQSTVRKVETMTLTTQTAARPLVKWVASVSPFAEAGLELPFSSGAVILVPYIYDIFISKFYEQTKQTNKMKETNEHFQNTCIQ